MRRYQIYSYSNFKAIYDLQKHLRRDHKSTRENVVKKFPVNTPNEEIERYIKEDLGGNPELNLLNG